MGSLIYDHQEFQFDDRILAHLQIVIVQRLRRQESFPMSWVSASGAGAGRSSIWLEASIPLHFAFLGSQIPTINRDWVRKLAESADSSVGLVVTTEEGLVWNSTIHFANARAEYQARNGSPS